MGRMLFSYVSNFILDDVYGADALLACIQFLYWMMCMELCFSCKYTIFILDDVYRAYALLVCIQFLYWMMCLG